MIFADFFTHYQIATSLLYFVDLITFNNNNNNNNNNGIAAHSYSKNLLMYLTVYIRIVQLRAACKSCRVPVT